MTLSLIVHMEHGMTPAVTMIVGFWQVGWGCEGGGGGGGGECSPADAPHQPHLLRSRRRHRPAGAATNPCRMPSINLILMEAESN